MRFAQLGVTQSNTNGAFYPIAGDLLAAYLTEG